MATGTLQGMEIITKFDAFDKMDFLGFTVSGRREVCDLRKIKRFSHLINFSKCSTPGRCIESWQLCCQRRTST